MYILDKDVAKKILTAELGYKTSDADLYLRDFPPVHDQLAGAVQAWLKDRTILNVSVFGLTIGDLMHLRRSNFLMAVQDLNRLMDSSLTAEERARLVKILGKPYIRM